MTAQFAEVETSMGDIVVQRMNADGSVTHIPSDPANADYQAYLVWKAEQEAKA